MKVFFSIVPAIILSCTAQSNVSTSEADQSSISIGQTNLQFEDFHHYRFSFIEGNYKVIKTQKEMDQIFTKIHSNLKGNRLAPIPTIDETSTYVILKPVLKNTNDVEITKIWTGNSTLYIDVKPFNDPQISSSLRTQPNILLKISENIDPKKIIINYK